MYFSRLSLVVALLGLPSAFGAAVEVSKTIVLSDTNHVSGKTVTKFECDALCEQDIGGFVPAYDHKKVTAVADTSKEAFALLKKGCDNQTQKLIHSTDERGGTFVEFRKGGTLVQAPSSDGWNFGPEATLEKSCGKIDVLVPNEPTQKK